MLRYADWQSLIGPIAAGRQMKQQRGWTDNLQVESASCSAHVIAGGQKMINENRNSPSTAGGEITFTGTHHHGRLSVTILKMLFIWPLVFCFTAEQRWRSQRAVQAALLISVIHQKMVIRATLYARSGQVIGTVKALQGKTQ